MQEGLALLPGVAALNVIVGGDGDHALGALLTDYVFIQMFVDGSGRRDRWALGFRFCLHGAYFPKRAAIVSPLCPRGKNDDHASDLDGGLFLLIEEGSPTFGENKHLVMMLGRDDQAGGGGGIG